MKKILLTIFLTIFLLGMLEGVVSAQTVKGPPECIKLRSDINLKNVKTGEDTVALTMQFKKGAIVAKRKLGENECQYAMTGIQTACTGALRAEGTSCFTFNSGDFGILAMLNTIHTVTNWLFYILMLVVVLMVIFGGFMYITAAGDPEKAGKGKQVLTYAIIGLAIALVAKLVPSVVKFILGMGGGGSTGG